MESKAISVMIEAGRRSRERRYATSGPLVPRLPSREAERDLPAARHRPETGHGHKTGQVKEGHT